MHDGSAGVACAVPGASMGALSLVASFLDASSLAAASCFSTSWQAAFAADHLWARL
jgi:hypothetical protein